MSRDNRTVKREDGETTQFVPANERQHDVKIENDSLSVSTHTIDTLKMKRIRQSFSHLPSVKEQALGTFTEIKESVYQYEDLGESQQEDVMACECKPQMGLLSCKPFLTR